MRCDTDMINEGEELEVDLGSGVIKNLSRGMELPSTRIPEFMAKILSEGGLLPYIDKYGDFQP